MPSDSPFYELEDLKPGSFIYRVADALAPEQCREIINRFEASPDQQYQGRIGQRQLVDTGIKKSTDLRVSGREEWQDVDRILFESLSRALRSIAAIHPFFAANAFKDMGYNVQRTQEGEYYHWHVDMGPGDQSQRQLVALWYLNDVPGPGGATEFYHQELSVQPTEGALVLFPPYWTHVHRNSPLEKGVKYIATTWVCFR